MELRALAVTRLGSPEVSIDALSEAWNSLTARLREIKSKCDAFEKIAEVTDLIEMSGAPRWARRLRSNPVNGVEDELLPGDWENRWRLRRLERWLDANDKHHRLRELGHDRNEKETLLERAYERSVELRTWLELSKKASDGVKR